MEELENLKAEGWKRTEYVYNHSLMDEDLFVALPVCRKEEMWYKQEGATIRLYIPPLTDSFLTTTFTLPFKR